MHNHNMGLTSSESLARTIVVLGLLLGRRVLVLVRTFFANGVQSGWLSESDPSASCCALLLASRAFSVNFRTRLLASTVLDSSAIAACPSLASVP